MQRMDSGGVNRDWAKPSAGLDSSLRHIAMHMGGSILYEVAVPAGASRRVALALCEGWWKEAGQRVQVLRVEGAEPKTVDTVADIGQNKAAAFWFEARDANGDGKIEIAVEAAPRAADKNTILNGLWVFAADAKPDSDALLAGKLNSLALARMNSIKPGGPARNDLILVRVTNNGTATRTLQPRLIVDTTLEFMFQPDAAARHGQRSRDDHRVVEDDRLGERERIAARHSTRGADGAGGPERDVLRALQRRRRDCDRAGHRRAGAGQPRPGGGVLGKGAIALWPRAGAGRRHSGVGGFVHPQHLAGARDQEGVAGFPGRPDVLSRAVDRGRRVPARSRRRWWARVGRRATAWPTN